jgi:hypothetical protein
MVMVNVYVRKDFLRNQDALNVQATTMESRAHLVAHVTTMVVVMIKSLVMDLVFVMKGILPKVDAHCAIKDGILIR